MGNSESSEKPKIGKGDTETKVGVTTPLTTIPTEVEVGWRSSRHRDVEFLKCLRDEQWLNATALLNYGANVDCSLALLPSLTETRVWSNRVNLRYSAGILNYRGLRNLTKFLNYPVTKSTTRISIKMGEPRSPGSVLNYLCRGLLRSEIIKSSGSAIERGERQKWEIDGEALRLISLVIDATATANLDARDYQGYTALHHLARSNQPHLIDKLIKRGADPEARCAGGGEGNGMSARELIVRFWRKFNPPIDTILPPPPLPLHSSGGGDSIADPPSTSTTVAETTTAIKSLT